MRQGILSQFEYNKMQVLYLTGMTSEQYITFQIDTAKAWVEFYCKNIIDTQALLITSTFWGWWVLQWNNVDDGDILKALYCVPQALRHAQYRQLHQYVFDANNVLQRYMAKDFTCMVSYFEKEIKKISVNE
jgi:hypothetical protein